MRLGIVMLLAADFSWAQEMPADAQRVLDLAKSKVLNTTRNLPRYTCQESIAREYLTPRKPIRQKDVCPATEPTDLIREATDRVRLEVAIAEGREIQAWPGASHFDLRDADELVTTGPISTGMFGTLLRGVFDNQGAQISFSGEKMVEGQRVFHYTYRVPVTASQYLVKLIIGSWAKTSYSGDFEISADAADLTKLSEDTGTLWVDSGMCRAQTSIDYHYETVGDGGFLIPKQARLRTTHPDGSATMSVTAFSACHQYAAESIIRFDEADAPTEKEATGAEQASAAFAGGLEILLKLAAPIDTETASAGDVVAAIVSRPVLNPKSKAVIAPAGLRVRGRIVSARHFLTEDHGFEIAMEFERYEMKGILAPFAAILEIGEARVADAKVSLRPLPTGGLMNFHTKSARIVIPAGTELKWMTITPPKAK